MEWYIVAIAVVALGVAAVVASGRGGSMAKEPVRDTYAMTVPEGPFDGSAVRELRFGVVLRGYAMDQVDDVLDRVAADLEARDARIAQLEAQLGTSATTTRPSSAPPDTSASAWEDPR
jgi:DivIVA domain-containing protein